MIERPHILVGVPSTGTQSDCDCACPDHGLALAPTPSAAPTSAWQRAPDLYRDTLPGEADLAFLPGGDGRVVVLNRAAGAVLEAFSQPQPLAGPAHLPPESPFATVAARLAAHRLLSPVAAPLTVADGPPTTLSVWLHVTSACNLRCTYCYVARGREDMAVTIGQAAIDAAFRSALRGGFQALQLKYAGGEASLNFPLVRELHTYAARHVRRNALDLSEVLLSNGVALTRPMLAYLREEGIALAISLDGLGPDHDRQRPFADGRGSAADITRTIEHAIAAGLDPVLSVTVTAGNAGSLAEVTAFALDHDLRLNFNFYRTPTQGSQSKELEASPEQLIAGLRAALALIAARPPRRRLIDGLIDRSAFGQAHQHACGAGRSYLAITPYGEVAPCQMLLHQPVTSIRDPDPLTTLKLHPSAELNLPVDRRPGCADCLWRYQCAGGCPLLAARAEDGDHRSPYCAVYTAIFPELLRLEGLRLIRWAPLRNPATEALEAWV